MMKGLSLSSKVRPVSISSNRDMINFVRKVKLAPLVISGWGKSVLYVVYFYYNWYIFNSFDNYIVTNISDEAYGVFLCLEFNQKLFMDPFSVLTLLLN